LLDRDSLFMRRMRSILSPVVDTRFVENPEGSVLIP
jgi:hypothetical protein